MSEHRVWRKVTCREPLLASPSALGHEYEKAAVNRPYGDEPCDGVYVIDVHGPLEHHEHVWFASFENIHRMSCEALDRPDVRALILRIDSPGGVANGMAAASRSLRAHADRLEKLIYVYADEQICSAAYGIACAADEIWGPRTAEIGSVGVILPVCDQTQANEDAGILVDLIVTGDRKGDGHPDKKLDQATRDALQARVDAIGADFFELVAEARKMTPEAVQALQAGVFVGPEAVAAGLADGVADWQEFYDLVKSAVNPTVNQKATVQKAGSVVRSKPSATKRREVLTMARTKRLAQNQAKLKAIAALEEASRIEDPKARAEAVKKAAASLFAASKMYKKTIKVEESIDDDDEKKKEKYEAEIDEEDEAEDDAEDAEEEGEEEPKKDGEDDAEDDAEDEEEDDAEDDAEDKDDDEPESSRRGAEVEKMKKSRKAASVAGLVRALTGSADRNVQLGKLAALAEKASRFDAMAQDVSRLKRADREARVSRLIQSAIDSKKVAPTNAKQIKFLREQGMDSPKRLRAYIDAMPRLLPRTLDDGPLGASLDASGGPVATDSLSVAARNVIETTARLTGKSIEAATADYFAAYKRAAGR